MLQFKFYTEPHPTSLTVKKKKKAKNDYNANPQQTHQI